ncbi:MAG: hypothetical protein ACREOK_09510 [Gemmatimonadaceae bacterium]
MSVRRLRVARRSPNLASALRRHIRRITGRNELLYGAIEVEAQLVVDVALHVGRAAVDAKATPDSLEVPHVSEPQAVRRTRETAAV